MSDAIDAPGDTSLTPLTPQEFSVVDCAKRFRC